MIIVGILIFILSFYIGLIVADPIILTNGMWVVLMDPRILVIGPITILQSPQGLMAVGCTLLGGFCINAFPEKGSVGMAAFSLVLGLVALFVGAISLATA
ncbi:MAG: hypothetical protein KAQ63_01755 [Candidatus Moranbacteria bacterium]|nr:hypothetical protein [Candidatus Moranbacteria bacterium]